MKNNVDLLDTFEQVVVLMLENRSFDNLLGHLYSAEEIPEGKSFAGVQVGEHSNPVPERMLTPVTEPKIKLHTTLDYNQPFPDPGEVYPHINTQLFNHIDSYNVGVPEDEMKYPYNLPTESTKRIPNMQGFVNDYINTLEALDNKLPAPEQYQSVMTCYAPDTVSVLSTLAKEFAVFDHWFSSVPSQTWCNRAFWHSATSSGHVANPTTVDQYLHWFNDVWSQPNLFDRLAEKGLSYRVYSDFPIDLPDHNGNHSKQLSGFGLTRLISGVNPDMISNSPDLAAFKQDVENVSLSKYNFIEPRFMFEHNDQHPCGATGKTDGPTHTGTVLLGEKLIWDVYQAIKDSARYKDNTLLIITHDEHGGCYDHVAPPAAVPPKAGAVGQDNFQFDRLGVRVPMVMISSHIAKNTIINTQHDHTSFIKTLSQKWQLDPLTKRDKAAVSFSNVFSQQKREWPEVAEPSVPKAQYQNVEKREVHSLQRSLLHGLDVLSSVEGKKEYQSNTINQLNSLKDAADYLAMNYKLWRV
jgi:phospholipase C